MLGVLALALMAPYQDREAERVAADHIGLLAEAVAATYEQDEPTTKKKAAGDDDEIERELDDKDIEREHVHRAREILVQLQRADGVIAIDVANHAGVVKLSTKAGRVGTQQKPPNRLRQSHVDGDALTVSYAIPFTQRCVGCHEARQDPVGAVHVVVDKAAAFSSLDRYRTVMGMVLAGTYVILVLLIVVVADRLVGKPVHALARLMKRAERGDFLVRARVVGDDELGALATAFNRMLRAITSMKAHDIEREHKLNAAEQELAMKQELAVVAERLQVSNAALERRVRAQELLMEAAHRLGSTLDKAALLERLSRVIREKLGRPDFLIYLVVEAEDHEARLEVVRASGLLDRDDVRGRRFRVGEGITGLVAETGAPLLVHDLRDPFARTATPPAVQTPPMIEEGSLVAVPMLHKGRVVGVFEFYDPRIGAFDDDDGKLLEALGAQAAMAVVNADLYQTTLELSVTDSLTKLMNRRALNRLLDAELERARRFNTPLAVLMLDVDHFKQYNDRMGHLMGDDALKGVALALSQSVRKVDAVARFGGEEFCVVLPRTDEVAGMEVAEKLIKAVRALDLPGGSSQPLGRMSISVGVAVYPDDMPPAFDEPPIKVLVDVADQAAYEAKRRGRDRIVAAGEARPKKPKLHDGPGKKEVPSA
ncbi:MAG: diguanylate cyclase [Deltaproteobacteria bacterium]|nr:diguanylate cyclase [Deltaproteobacteria bacterium]